MKIKDKSVLVLSLFQVVFWFTLVGNVTKAEVVSLIPKCVEDKCLSSISDLIISPNGSICLIVDSSANPYIRKLSFSSGKLSENKIINLNQDNPDDSIFMVGISQNSKKAFSFGESSSTIHIIDLVVDSIKDLSITLDGSTQTISTLAFADFEGNKLFASNDDSEAPKLLIINTETGKTEKSFSLPGIAQSIEVSPNFNKAVITFKEPLLQSIGILNNKTKELLKLDIPSDILFDLDEFLSMVDFDDSGSKAVVSSLDGRHVLHLLNLTDDEFTIKFLSDDIKGKTLSTIDTDGNLAISVGNNPDENGFIVYKLNATKVKLPKIIKSKKFNDGGSIIDVLITPDKREVLLLTKKDNNKILKILNLTDLSLICEFVLSNDAGTTFLAGDPYGRYFLSSNPKDNSISSVTDLAIGPIFKSITPNEGSKAGGTSFTIDGFIDPTIFTEDIKICFQNKRFCSSSTMISNDGLNISGITPKVPFKKFTNLILITKPKTTSAISDVSSSGFIVQCKKQIRSVNRFNKVFKFE